MYALWRVVVKEFHQLRDTCASDLLRAGAAVLQVPRLLGHHSPSFTLEVYGHVLDGELLDVDALRARHEVAR